MSELLVGTLVGAFVTVLTTWGNILLQNHVSNKNNSKKTMKQKAVEAYALTNSLEGSIHEKTALCRQLIKDGKSFPSTYKFSNTTSDNLDKLELLIVENFNDVWKEFLAVRTVLVEQLHYLSNIIKESKNEKISLSDFQQKVDTFNWSVNVEKLQLQNSFREGYINKKRWFEKNKK